MRAGLVVHPARPRALEVGAEIVTACRERGIATRSLDEVDVGADERAAGSLADGADLVVSVGGDGTLLRAALLASEAAAPVLGVNVGRLGFLSDIEPPEVPAMLDAFVAGDLVVEERLTVEAEAEGAPWSDRQWALNEIMVEKRARQRVISLAVYVGGEYVTTISGDGVIVATPTGSTAYSFAARGPIVHPRVECLILTPVSPHMVFDRPLVLAPDEQVQIEVRGDEPGLLAPDGRGALELPLGARVRIRRSDRPARLLRRLGAESFFARLARKFSLPS
ncbi:MAG TPA: NAD(+)/NADH kinase [Actinomycetota bacterium]